MKKVKKAKTPRKRSSGSTTRPVRPGVEREPARPGPRDGKVAPDDGTTAEFKAGKDL